MHNIKNQIKKEDEDDNENGDSEMQIPLSLVSCPLTGQIMKNPVIVNGRDYEQEAIIRYSMDNDGFDPHGMLVKQIQESSTMVK